MSKRLVVALGGNALSCNPKEKFSRQYERSFRSLEGLVPLFRSDYEVAITHGNGPQVGNTMRRMELSSDEVSPLPLAVCNALTQGEIGSVIEMAMKNLFVRYSLKGDSATVLTEVIVNKSDPAFDNPTKFIGSFYTEDEAKQLAKRYNWVVREDSGRGWRRVVPSPVPVDILQKRVIENLVASGVITICTGGGGIPVIRVGQEFRWIDAVIDKDLASSLLARIIRADTLLILTAVDSVYLNFNTPRQKRLGKVSLDEIKRYHEQGHFPAGSMGPKIESAISFLESGGREVIITSIDRVEESIGKDAGTHITI